jgi:hypothetical protein
VLTAHEWLQLRRLALMWYVPCIQYYLESSSGFPRQCVFGYTTGHASTLQASANRQFGSLPIVCCSMVYEALCSRAEFTTPSATNDLVLSPQSVP